MSSPVYLHVGVAKTGTTYLQRLLFANRELLRSNGVLFPGDRRAAHFHASLGLRGVGFKGHEYPEAEGAWERLAAEANGFVGATLISHETLARTNPDVIERAVASFTGDVRVVVTARDLGRQLPAVWQERLKNRNEQTYDDFLEEVLGARAVARLRGNFWDSQWLPGVVARWGGAVGTDRVTIVTVPQAGADPQQLWNRFAQATELPALPYDFALDSSNTSVGTVEAELLRRLNAELSDLTWPQYERRIKRGFAERTLAPIGRSPRIGIPAGWHDQVLALADRLVEELAASGAAVVGDLGELQPRLSTAGGDPGRVSESELLELSTRLVAGYAAAPEPKPERRSRPRPTELVRKASHPRTLWRRVRSRATRG